MPGFFFAQREGRVEITEARKIIHVDVWLFVAVKIVAAVYDVYQLHGYSHLFGLFLGACSVGLVAEEVVLHPVQFVINHVQ